MTMKIAMTMLLLLLMKVINWNEYLHSRWRTGLLRNTATATATAAAALATAHCSPPYRTAGKGTPDTTQSPVNRDHRQTQPCLNLFM